MAFGIMTFIIHMLISTISIMALYIMTFNIRMDEKHILSIVTLSVIYAECRLADCRGAISKLVSYFLLKLRIVLFISFVKTRWSVTSVKGSGIYHRMFSLIHPSLIFAGKARSTPECCRIHWQVLSNFLQPCLIHCCDKFVCSSP